MKIPQATVKQQEYIEQSCIDLSIVDRKRRNAAISNILGSKISYLDELTTHEASKVITILK